MKIERTGMHMYATIYLYAIIYIYIFIYIYILIHIYKNRRALARWLTVIILMKRQTMRIGDVIESPWSATFGKRSLYFARTCRHVYTTNSIGNWKLFLLSVSPWWLTFMAYKSLQSLLFFPIGEIPLPFSVCLYISFPLTISRCNR